MSDTIQTAQTIILNVNLEGPNAFRLQARLDGTAIQFELIDRDKKAHPVNTGEASVLLEMRRAVVK